MSIRRLLFFIFLICCRHILFARDLPVRYLGIDQGLSNNAVVSICQDHNGFLWFGTYDGLNRYDGYGFKIFHNVIGDSTSLAINNIYTIEEDNSGDIWVGGQKGLSIYNVLTSKFSKVRYTSLSGSLENLQDNVHLVKAVGPDCILVATQHTGLLLFKKGTANGLQISLNDLHSGDYDVTALEQSTDHRLWVFVQHEGLFSYDLTQKKLLRVNSSILQGNCLKTDRKGRLWLANDAGLFLYDPKSNGYSGNFMPAKVKIVTLCSDKQGALWIGSDGTGLWALPDNAPLASPMTGSNGRPLINSNSAFTIYEDAEGRKWINHRQLDCLLYPISPSLFYFFPNLLGK